MVFADVPGFDPRVRHRRALAQIEFDAFLRLSTIYRSALKFMLSCKGYIEKGRVFDSPRMHVNLNLSFYAVWQAAEALYSYSQL